MYARGMRNVTAESAPITLHIAGTSQLVAGTAGGAAGAAGPTIIELT